MNRPIPKVLKRALGLILVCCMVFQFFVPAVNAQPIDGSAIVDGQPSISVSPSNIHAECTVGGMAVTVNYTGVGSWECSSRSSWLTVSKSSGSQIYISWTYNSGSGSRTGYVDVYNDEALFATVTVTQDPPASHWVSVSGAVPTVPADGGSFTLTVTTDCTARASISSDASWLNGNYSGAPQGVGGAEPTATSTTAYIICEPNDTGSERIGHITFTHGNSVTVTVTQEANTSESHWVSVSGAVPTVPADGGSFTLTVTTDCTARASIRSDASWLNGNYSGAPQGVGGAEPTSTSTTAYINCEPNNTGSERIGHITFTHGNSVTVEVKQAAGQTDYSVTLSEYAHTVPATAGTFTVTVTSSGGRPRMSSDASWLVGTYAGAPQGVGGAEPAAYGSSTAYINYDANNTGSERIGHVFFILNNRIGATLEVKQQAGQASASVITVMPSSLSFSASGGAKNVSVISSAGLPCLVVSKPDWISVPFPYTVSSGGTIAFTAERNTGDEIRTGIIDLASNDGVHKAIFVKQYCNLVELSTSLRDVGGEKGDFRIIVTSNCGQPSISTNAGWLSAEYSGLMSRGVSQTSSISYEVIVHYDANIVLSQRTGRISFSAGGKTAELTVNQGPADAVEKRVQVWANKQTDDSDNKAVWELCKTAFVEHEGGTAHAGASGSIFFWYSGGSATFGAPGYISRTFSQEEMLSLNQVKLYQDDGPHLMGVWINGADALTSGAMVEIGTACSIRPEIEWNGSTHNSQAACILTQGGQSIIIPEGGSSQILSDSFDLTETIYASIVLPNSDVRVLQPLKIGLDYNVPSWMENISIGFNDGVSCGIPLGELGSFQFGVSMPTLPCAYSVEKGKFKIAIGLSKGSGVQDIDDYVEEIQNMIDQIKNYGKPKLGGQSGEAGIPVTITAGGYIEGFFNKKGEAIVVKSGIFMSGSASFSHSQEFLVGTVPAFLETELVGGLTANLGIWLGRNGGIGVSGDLSVSAGASIGVGVGIAGVLGVSGGIKGSAQFDVGYSGSALNKFLITLALKGYLKVTALVFVRELPIDIAERTWNGLSKAAAADAEALYAEAFAEALADPSQFKPQSLDYLRAGSAFRDGSDPNVFVSNAYQNAVPQLLSWPDGRKLAVWVGYDPTRSGYDALCLYASYFNGTAWSEPFQVEDDGTMDGTPAAAMIGDCAVLVWQDAKAHIPDTIELNAIGEYIDLSLGVFNPQSGSFSVTGLTNDDKLDMLPALSGYATGENAAELSVAWVCSGDNSWFGSQGGNRIKLLTGQLTADAGFAPSASAPSVAADACNDIQSLAVFYAEGAPHVFYSMDTDGDPATRGCTLFQDGAPAAEGDGFGVRIVNGHRYWTVDKDLYCDGELIETALGTDRIQILDENGVRAILFQENTWEEEQEGEQENRQGNPRLCSKIYAAVYDEVSDSWTSPAAILESRNCILSFMAAAGPMGIELIVNDQDITIAGNGSPIYGDTRITMYQQLMEADLRVTDLSFDPKNYEANCEMPFDLYLENVGLSTIGTVEVRVLDGNGVELSSKDYPLFLRPGESQVLPCSYLVEDFQPDAAVTFTVMPKDQMDVDPDDNSVSAVFSCKDLLLERPGWGTNTEGQTYVYANVVNEGYHTVQSATVSLRKDAADSPIVSTVTVTDLARHSGKRAAFPVEYEEGAVYYLTIEDADDDISANNTDFVVLMKDVPKPIETDELRIFSSISVGTDMVVTWSARKSDVASYEKFWIEVVKHTPDGDETYLYGADQDEALDESTSAWQANFRHIFAKEMGVDIEARVYAEDANGQIYRSPAKTTNIRDYLGGRLTATNNTVSQRVLAADLLNYGAAAQIFMNYDTGHLVNEELTAEQLAKLDEYETKGLPPVEKTNSNYRPAGASNILFNSVSLDNEVVLSMSVKAPENSNVFIMMKDHNTGGILSILSTTWSGSSYTVDYKGLGADKMRTQYDFVAWINGAETGNTRTWSIEGYVGELRSGGNQLQIDVANALLIYGDSAAAYFAAQ